MAIQVEKLFSEEEKEKVLDAIKQAELNTSGQIRLYIENHCPGNVLDRSAHIFAKLEMHKTKQRNGVLFYLAVLDRKFAILGDAGIHAVVGKHFWDKIKSAMEAHFKKEEFYQGMCEGFRMTGEALKKHFPHQEDGTNEIPDDIVYGGEDE